MLKTITADGKKKAKKKQSIHIHHDDDKDGKKVKTDKIKVGDKEEIRNEKLVKAALKRAKKMSEEEN